MQVEFDFTFHFHTLLWTPLMASSLQRGEYPIQKRPNYERDPGICTRYLDDLRERTRKMFTTPLSMATSTPPTPHRCLTWLFRPSRSLGRIPYSSIFRTTSGTWTDVTDSLITAFSFFVLVAAQLTKAHTESSDNLNNLPGLHERYIGFKSRKDGG